MTDFSILISSCFLFIVSQILLYFGTMKGKVYRGAEVFSLFCSMMQIITLFSMIYFYSIGISQNEARSFYLDMIPSTGLRRMVDRSRLGTLFSA